MAKLHAFAHAMDPITEFDGDDEDVVPWQKPKCARQLAMEDEERPDPHVENKTKEDWPDSYDITVTFPPPRDCTKSTSGMKKEFTDWRH